MSDTIDARYCNAKRATLLQGRPGTIIDVAESFHQTVSPMTFYGGGEGHVIGTGSMGSVIARLTTAGTRTVVLVDCDWATSAVAAVELENYYSSDSWLRWAKAAKNALERSTTEDKAAPSAAARLRVERLAAVQAALGLSTSDMAQVLGLSRPGLYKWLDASNDVRLQEASRERLATVERIAKQWRERSASTLGAVAQEPLANGGTVLAMMTAENIDEVAVGGALDELVAKVAGKPKSRSQKLTEAGFKRRPSSRSLPSDD